MSNAAFWLVVAVLGGLMAIFLWQVVELTIATDEMFDALEAALEARQ